MSLFRQDASLRTEAAAQLLQLDAAVTALQQSSSAAAKKVAQDPFAGLLDNGIGADLTTAPVTAAAQSFRWAAQSTTAAFCIGQSFCMRGWDPSGLFRTSHQTCLTAWLNCLMGWSVPSTVLHECLRY